MKIQVLGCSGGIGKELRTSAFLVDQDILLDAGTGVGDLALDQLLQIEHVFLTHAHLDHLAALPMLIDTVADRRRHPLTIHAPAAVLAVIRTHVFNWSIWPDFSEIPSRETPLLQYHAIEVGESFWVGSRTLYALPVSHSVPAVAWRLQGKQGSVVYSGDTGPGADFWAALNGIDDLRALIVECAFPDQQRALADVSRHFCPQTLAEGLQQLSRPCPIFITHLKPEQAALTMAQIDEGLPGFKVSALRSGHVLSGDMQSPCLVDDNLLARLEQLHDVGISLSSERNITRLLEKILQAARRITYADGGTLYRMSEDGQRLHFEIVRNDSLNIAFGGSEAPPALGHFPDLALYRADGVANDGMVAVYAALTGTTVSIPDAYAAEGFDFNGTRAFDKRTGYRSQSFLTVPMKNHLGEIIGVLQLINAIAPDTRQVRAFSEADRRLVESLASQAAIALSNRRLIDEHEHLFEAFIKVISLAIDEKSPHTGGHCQRVPELTMMLADAVDAVDEGPLAEFRLTEKDRYELRIAALMHDFGKVTTPVHVVDKATKLQTIFDRIELVDTRFAVLKREAEFALLQRQLAGDSVAALQLARDDFFRQCDVDRAFLHHANIGSERMAASDIARVQEIAARYRYTDCNGQIQPLLSQEECANLTIPAGTLNAEEREIINYHIVATIKMLEQLPWPRHLRNVPEYAGGHHERMDGKGYPRGLKREQMSWQARMMGIADIFEALTAKDRPYKPAMPLSQALEIMDKFRNNGHIDADLYEVFVQHKVYRRYGEAFLDPQQLDR